MQEPATHLVRRSGGETWCGLPASGVTLMLRRGQSTLGGAVTT